jgi:hypothetical protein
LVSNGATPRGYKKIMHVISDFRVQDKAELYQKLDAAVTAAQAHASVDGAAGVLVTRHDFSRFSVTLSPNVPFGLIHEVDQARRN